jgi:phosphatidylglycerophosphatase A
MLGVCLTIRDRIAIFVGTTLGTGFFPIAPGTVGSFVAVLALFFAPVLPLSFLIAIILASFLIGVWAAGRCEKIWGKDPGRVNWDEVVGQMITLLWVPKILTFYAAGFLLFRFFDIVKPSPVRNAEKLPGGWGIMMDDVFAGIYAAICLQVARYVLSVLG